MDSLYEFSDDRFHGCVLDGGPPLECLYSVMQFGEGPVYFGDLDELIWSDIPNSRMLRLAGGQVSVFRHPTNNANGNTRDREGRLLTCEQGSRRVTRTERDGTITVIADSYRGRKLNSPNDIVVKSDGSIWFSDPTYGISNDWEGIKAPREQEGNNVFRVEPRDGSITVVADDCEMPNGLAFSLDEKKLYVSDTGISESPTGAHHIRVYDVVDGRQLANPRVFAEISPGCPDGFRLDTEGCLWTSAGDGVHCISPEGELLGRIKTPEPITNLTFGGPRRNRLFMTGPRSLWSIYVNRRGAQIS
jgi:gluconolactonase